MDRIERLYQFMPSMYRPGHNAMLTAILGAFAVGDEGVSSQLYNAKDQIFVKRASGTFLDYLAANYKVTRPSEIPFVDDLFRQLIPVLTWWPKQVKPSIYKALELFWPYDYSHSTSVSVNAGTYNFVGGETLELMVDRKHPLAVVFTADSITAGAATAQEICTRINAWFPEYVYAHPSADQNTGLVTVKISTLTFGVAGSVQITGGTANGTLTTGAVVGADPMDLAVLEQAVSLASAKVTYAGTGVLSLTDVTGTFDLVNVVTGTNPDGTTFTFTPTATNPGLGFSSYLFQYPRISIHEEFPTELVVRIPKKFILNWDTRYWSHRFHPGNPPWDVDILNGRNPITGVFEPNENPPSGTNSGPYWPGHFFFDWAVGGTGSITLRNLKTTLVTPMATDGNTVIELATDVSQFPVNGYVVFDFGNTRQEICRYVSRPDNLHLMLDPLYKQSTPDALGFYHQFNHVHPPTENVNLCEVSPVKPRVTGEDYPIFFIDTEIAYDIVSVFVLLLKAAGVVVRWILDDE